MNKDTLLVMVGSLNIASFYKIEFNSDQIDNLSCSYVIKVDYCCPKTTQTSKMS